MSFFDQLLDPARRFERAYAEQLLRRFRVVQWPGARVDLENEWLEPRGATAALARSARVVVTGEPGMGKTTTLTHLALSHVRALLAREPRACVPFFFSARDLHPQALPRIVDLPRGLNLTDTLAAQCPRTFFVNVFRAGRALVLVDDLDVLTREQVEAWLKGLANPRVVATAQSAPVNFVEYQLPGLRDGDLDAVARTWDKARAEAFFAALKADGVPRALTANPFTFAMLTRIWRAGQSLPIRRTELFDIFARNVLGDGDEAAKMLEGIALAIQRGRPAPNEFLPKSRGFLRAGRNRTVEFVHELWQAYFAARAMRQSPDLSPLIEVLQVPLWSQVILFYAGLGDASVLVDALVARGDVALAGRAVAHAREVREDLRESVTRELVQRAWEGDGRATAALSEMNSESAVDGFAAKLKDRDPVVRTRATEILGQLQLDRGTEYLLPQLRDVNADVRDKVVEALGRSRTDRVIEPLLVALRGDPRVGQVDVRLRIAAAKALGEVASDKAVPALIVDLQLGEPEVRAVAAEALKRIKSPLLYKPLLGILHSGDEEARRYAAQVLAVGNHHVQDHA